jgi:hypothetical protein
MATPPPGKSGHGELTVTHKGGNVNLWTDETKTSAYTLPVESSEEYVEFWVEGLEPTTTLQDAGFDAEYKNGGTAYARIRYGITRADIRVDSNNKTIPPYAEPLDEEDEQIEFSTKPEHIGKILLENSGDVDHDGVMDSLDGLGLADTGGSAGVANLKLVPMKVKLEKPYDPTRAEVTFHYNASLPREDAKGIKKTVTNNVTTYEIAKRGLRLWKVDGDQRANGIDVTTNGGHFIPSGEPIPWRNLASSSATDTIIYLEYVDLPTGKTYSKEDIVYTIQENITEIEKKGYYKDSMNKTTYLAEKESPDGLCVSLLPVVVNEVWSDQIAGVEANGYPDKTGPMEYPYILIGANTDNTFRVKIKLGTEIPLSLQSRIKFRWASAAEGTNGDIMIPEEGTSTFIDGKTIQLSSGFERDRGTVRYLVMRLDLSSNGVVNHTENIIRLVTPHIQRGNVTTIPYQFIPITQTRYNDSKSELLGWANDAPTLGLREGARHLTAFCNGTIPAFAGSGPTEIRRNEPGLSHPVGVAFTPASNFGASFTAIISKDHDLSKNLVRSSALNIWLKNEFDKVGDYIRQDIITARRLFQPNYKLFYALQHEERNNKFFLVLTGGLGANNRDSLSPPKKSVEFSLSDPDLLVCLKKVALENIFVEFVVDMYGYVNNVKVFGLAHDLYDFDYGGEELLGYPARRASEIQAGFPTLGTGGKVFKTQIDLGGGNPYVNHNPPHYTFFPN